MSLDLILERAARLLVLMESWERCRLGRPIDMGGPRDVWLEFGVPPDPRLDNMYPVGAGDDADG